MASAGEINARLDYLHDTYGEFSVESQEDPLTSDASKRARELHDRGIPGAARVWVERDDETLLVREESRPDSWGVAGGLIDPDERADQAGVREVREETGIECNVTDVAYVHRAVRLHEAGGREPFEEIAVAFIAKYVRGNPQPEPSEICEVKWWSKLPERTHSPASRIGVNRLK